MTAWGGVFVEYDVIHFNVRRLEMKKTVTKEVTCCDCCEKEEYLTTCMNCGIEHCYDCEKTEGKKYVHAVNFSGSGDGYYCKKCDTDLISNRISPRHIAYRKIESLRNESKAWNENFRLRANEAEQEVAALRE